MKVDLNTLLNKEQARAASQIDGASLIIAGAGSGKTRMLTYKIAYMLSSGIDEKNILALTFTNKAAKEMSERIKTVTGRKLSDLTATTFHSFGLSLLKRYIHHLGYHNDFSLYDSNDNQALLKNAIISLGYQIADYNIYTLLAYFSDFKTGRKKEPEKDTAIYQIYNEFLMLQKAYNVVDFDDLIILPVRLFEKKSFILEEIQERYKYILVDEFQDTSLLQYKMISMIARKYRNIAVVGDDDQSIYSWRGANYENIVMFEHDFPERNEYFLEQNYRSCKSILEAANSVIKNNKERKDKALWTENKNDADIIIKEHDDGFAEAEYIAHDIKFRIRNNKKYSDFGILVRTNSLITQIENIFLEHEIPVKVSGGQSFYDRKEIRDILCYLKVIVNEKDDVSLLRIINTPRRAIGRVTVEKIREYADKNYLSLFDSMSELVLTNEINEKTKKSISSFIDLVKKWRRKSSSSSIIDDIVTDIKYKNMLIEEFPDSVKTVEYKMRGLDILSSSIKKYLDKNSNQSIRDYVNLTALLADEDDENAEKVNLMTMHASKGLEFDIVYLAGIEDNIIPSSRALEENPLSIDEERRLFYVAITRAKQLLIINHAKTRQTRDGEIKAALPSRFIKEIPSELFKKTEDLKADEKNRSKARLIELLQKNKQI